MRITSISLALTAVAAWSFSLSGCDSNSLATPTHQDANTPPPAVDADHDDHAGHTRDAGATGAKRTEGPHGGHLVGLGNEEYHAELLPDETTHAVTVQLLDATGKEPVVVNESEITIQLFQDGQFVKYVLTPAAGPRDAAGGGDRFTIIDADLCAALGHEENTARAAASHHQRQALHRHHRTWLR